MISKNSDIPQPNQIRLNYIEIPQKYFQIVRELYYFENLDLVLIIDLKYFFVFKVQENELIQNEQTNQIQKQINNKEFQKYHISEKTEQLFIYQNSLFEYNFQENQFQEIWTQDSYNQFYWNIRQFQLHRKYILQSWLNQIFISHSKNLKQILRNNIDQLIQKIDCSQQIFIIQYYLYEQVSFYFKLHHKVKILRKLTIKTNEQFIFNGRYILIYNSKRESHKLIDFSNLKIKNCDEDPTSYDKRCAIQVQDLDLFFITTQQKNQNQIMDQNNMELKHNTKVQNVLTNRMVKFLKYSRKNGLLIFYFKD